MKNKMVILRAVFAPLLIGLSCVSASASDAVSKSDKFKIHLNFDADGKISREKFLADNPADNQARKAKLELFFQKAVADHDGFLTMAETRAVTGQPPVSATATGETTPAEDEPNTEPEMPVVPPE